MSSVGVDFQNCACFLLCSLVPLNRVHVSCALESIEEKTVSCILTSSTSFSSQGQSTTVQVSI